MAVIDMKEKNRGSKELNQLTVISEGIPALGWVTLVSLVLLIVIPIGFQLLNLRVLRIQDNLPGPYVNEFKDSSMFWVNRVIKEYKDS